MIHLKLTLSTHENPDIHHTLSLVIKNIWKQNKEFLENLIFNQFGYKVKSISKEVPKNTFNLHQIVFRKGQTLFISTENFNPYCPLKEDP